MKIDLLKRKKTPYDLLINLESIFVRKTPDKNEKWRRDKHGARLLADFLQIKNSELLRLIKFGINENSIQNLYTIELIIQKAKDFEISFFKMVSPRYDRNTFTIGGFELLFKNIRNSKMFKDERLLGRGALYMKFNKGYQIPFYPFADYDKSKIKKLIRLLAQNISRTIKRFDSMLFFEIVMLSIEKIKIKTF